MNRHLRTLDPGWLAAVLGIVLATRCPAEAPTVALPAGVVLDLDADRDVTLEDGDRVSLWRNQVAGFAAKDFVKRDQGRKEKGSGRPTLRKAVKEINGHSALVFRQQELVCMDEDAFDSLTQGGGCTWLVVLAVYEQRVGLKDVNSFFGNLKNGGNYEGLWACLKDDNALWWGVRNGITFGRFDANNPQAFGPKLEKERYHLIAGRMAAGTGKVKLEVFAGSAAPTATTEIQVNPKANPSKMAVGQERDAVNHPGHESFDGEIARLLIFSRPLEDKELTALFVSLADRYGIKATAAGTATPAGNANAAGDGASKFKIAMKRETDQVEVKVEKDRTVFSIHSPFGISQATIERKDDKWPDAVTLRLHLKGLESFRASSGAVTLNASVSSHGDQPRARLWKDGKENSPLDAKDPLWMEIRLIGSDGKPAKGVPLNDGYFEMRLPKALFEGDPKSIAANWIDFYRN